MSRAGLAPRQGYAPGPRLCPMGEGGGRVQPVFDRRTVPLAYKTVPFAWLSG